MASQHSYVITLSNNVTEKEALQLVLRERTDLLIPDADGRKQILESLKLPQSYRRTFDMVRVEGHIRGGSVVEYDDPKAITLYEIKSTKKRLPNFPHGFFFGATANEFDLAKQLGPQFQFCFVCLHPEQEEDHRLVFLDLKSLEAMIRTKRIQYQVNL